MDLDCPRAGEKPERANHHQRRRRRRGSKQGPGRKQGACRVERGTGGGVDRGKTFGPMPGSAKSRYRVSPITIIRGSAMPIAKRAVAELLGTFWLVLGGVGSAVLAGKFPEVGIGLLGVSLAFGLTVV